MKIQHPWALLTAAIVTVLLVFAVRSRAEPVLRSESVFKVSMSPCPTAAQAEEHVQRLVSLPLPAGCPAPYFGRLYSKEMRDIIRGDIAILETLVVETEATRDLARRALMECRLAASEGLRDCAEALSPPPTPRSGLDSWVWAGLAGVTALAPLVACAAIDCGPDHVPWLISAGGTVLVVGIVWAIE